MDEIIENVVRNMDEMSDAAHNQALELIAQLIEAKATTAAEAAQIVRDSKVKA